MFRRLIDTGVLVRRVNRQHVAHQEIYQAIQILHQRGEELCVVPQNVYELWAISTRPVAVNGFGLVPEQALRLVSRVEELFRLLPDSAGLYEEWKNLVSEHRVSGKPSHDARLVAAMNLHGIQAILTLNVQDFVRYSGLSILHPQNVQPKRH